METHIIGSKSTHTIYTVIYGIKRCKVIVVHIDIDVLYVVVYACAQE